jgi:hypothetical protein
MRVEKRAVEADGRQHVVGKFAGVIDVIAGAIGILIQDVGAAVAKVLICRFERGAILPPELDCRGKKTVAASSGRVVLRMSISPALSDGRVMARAIHNKLRILDDQPDGRKIPPRHMRIRIWNGIPC